MCLPDHNSVQVKFKQFSLPTQESKPPPNASLPSAVCAGPLDPSISRRTAAHASLERKRSRGFPLIIISVINKSGRQCSKSSGDGPCTIPWIGLIQHAAKDAGENRQGLRCVGSGDTAGPSQRRLGIKSFWFARPVASKDGPGPGRRAADPYAAKSTAYVKVHQHYPTTTTLRRSTLPTPPHPPQANVHSLMLNS